MMGSEMNKFVDEVEALGSRLLENSGGDGGFLCVVGQDDDPTSETRMASTYAGQLGTLVHCIVNVLAIIVYEHGLSDLMIDEIREAIRRQVQNLRSQAGDELNDD